MKQKEKIEKLKKALIDLIGVDDPKELRPMLVALEAARAINVDTDIVPAIDAVKVALEIIEEENKS